MNTNSWIYDVLDDQQIDKHYALLHLLKSSGHANEWRTSRELDDVWLPHGVRLETFPREWLSNMQESHRGRSSRFEVISGDVDGHSTSELRSSRGGLVFSIRSVVRNPQSEQELLAMLRYPFTEHDESALVAADGNTNKDDDNNSDDDFELALESTALPKTAACADLVCSAIRNGLVVWIRTDNRHGAVQRAATRGNYALMAAGDDDEGSRQDGLLAVTAVDDCVAWWNNSPVSMLCRIKTRRDVMEDMHNLFPQELCEGERLGVLLQRDLQHSFNQQTLQVPSSGNGSFHKRFAVSFHILPRPSDGGPLLFSDAASSSSRGVAVPGNRDTIAFEWRTEPSARDKHQFSMIYDPSRRHAPKDGTLWQEAKIRCIVEEMVTYDGKATQDFVSEFTWTVTLRPCPDIIRPNHQTDRVYALFPKELQCPHELPDDIALPFFDPSVVDVCGLKEKSTNSTRQGRLQRSWWANVSSAVTKIAASVTPSQAAVDEAANVLLPKMSLTDRISGQELREQPSSATRASDVNAKKKRRRRFRDLRNTHLVHYGLDLKVPFHAHVHFGPQSF